jgi:hypothetical protein
VITRAKEFNDLVQSWFGEDPEGWSNDDMIANYKESPRSEHGDLLNQAGKISRLVCRTTSLLREYHTEIYGSTFSLNPL